MPGYTGFEICEKLRNVPATAALPVVLSVGKMEPFREEDATKVGANGTLAKPFVAEQMLAVIRGLLGEPVVETKPVQPLQPPPPAPTAEDEPMFAYAALGQELRDKGEGFQNPSTVERRLGRMSSASIPMPCPRHSVHRRRTWPWRALWRWSPPCRRPARARPLMCAGFHPGMGRRLGMVRCWKKILRILHLAAADWTLCLRPERLPRAWHPGVERTGC